MATFTYVNTIRYYTDDAIGGPRFASGDYNGDGLTDVAFYQTPSESFTYSTTYSGASMHFFSVADDSRLYDTSSTITTWGWTGSPINVAAMETADLNGDGIDDLIVATSGVDPYVNGYGVYDPTAMTGEQPYIYLSSATTGTTTLTTASGAPYVFAHDVSVGDIDGDGDGDAFVNSLSSESGRLSYLIVGDDQTLTVDRSDLPSYFTSGDLAWWSNDAGATHSYTSSALIDADGDDDLDLALMGINSAQSRLLTNDGTGTFQDLGDILPAGPYGSGSFTMINGVYNAAGTQNLDTVVIDLNGDGLDDMLVLSTYVNTYIDAEYSGSEIQALVSNGDGTFTDQSWRVDYGVGAGHHNHYDELTLVDFDYDGDDDLVVTQGYGNSDQSTVFLSNNGGTFSQVDLASQMGGNGVYIPVIEDEVLTGWIKQTNTDMTWDASKGTWAANTQMDYYVADFSGMTANQEKVMALVDAVTGETPDYGTFQSYSSMLDTGATSTGAIANALISSEGLWGASRSGFLDSIWENIYGRAATADEKAWVRANWDGLTPTSFVENMAGGSEQEIQMVGVMNDFAVSNGLVVV